MILPAIHQQKTSQKKRNQSSIQNTKKSGQNTAIYSAKMRRIICSCTNCADVPRILCNTWKQTALKKSYFIDGRVLYRRREFVFILSYLRNIYGTKSSSIILSWLIQSMRRYLLPRLVIQGQKKTRISAGLFWYLSCVVLRQPCNDCGNKCNYPKIDHLFNEPVALLKRL